MRRTKVATLIVLLVCAGCSREPEVPPLSDEEQRLAKEVADAFLGVALKKTSRAEEIEKYLFSGLHPQWRPRLAFAIKQARSSPQCEWFETDATVTGDKRMLVSVRYDITVAGQSKALALYLAKEEDGQYRVTGANILEREKEK